MGRMVEMIKASMQMLLEAKMEAKMEERLVCGALLCSILFCILTCRCLLFESFDQDGGKEGAGGKNGGKVSANCIGVLVL